MCLQHNFSLLLLIYFFEIKYDCHIEYWRTCNYNNNNNYNNKISTYLITELNNNIVSQHLLTKNKENVLSLLQGINCIFNRPF